MKFRGILARLWLVLPFLLLMLPACNLPSSTCTEAELQAPINLEPHEEIVDSLVNVNLSWKYPASTCTPDFFEAYVWTGLEPEHPGMTVRVNFDYPSPSGDYQLPWSAALQPGNTYFFRVYAGLETGPGSDVHGPKALSWFYTGPECALDETMQPVVLSNPADDSVIDPNEDMTFVWDDPTPCRVHGLFEIQISLQEDFSDYLHRIPVLQTAYTVPNWEFDPDFQNCTRYYWRVKTDPAGPQEWPFSEVWSFFAQTPGSVCPITDLIHPFGIAQLDLNCRSGPSPLYAVLGALPKGSEAPIQGRNADSSWWLIQNPDQLSCWVWGEQFDVQGDTSQVQIVTVAPPPEPTPTNTAVPVNCGQYKDPKTCNANSACTWYQPLVGGPGSCKNK